MLKFNARSLKTDLQGMYQNKKKIIGGKSIFEKEFGFSDGRKNEFRTDVAVLLFLL